MINPPPSMKQEAKKEQLIPRPPQSAPPLSLAASVIATPDNNNSNNNSDNGMLQSNQNKNNKMWSVLGRSKKKEERLLSTTPEDYKTSQQKKEDKKGERLAAQAQATTTTTSFITSTAPPKKEGLRVNNANKDVSIPRQQGENGRRVVSTIGGKMTVTKSGSSKFIFAQSVATWQSWVIGGVVGAVAVTPVFLLHHFYFFPAYESIAQWEFDTLVAFIQGAVFAAVYRYAIRDDWDEEKLGRAVFTAFFLVRSLVGINVPMSCSAPFLFCKLRISESQSQFSD